MAVTIRRELLFLAVVSVVLILGTIGNRQPRGIFVQMHVAKTTTTVAVMAPPVPDHFPHEMVKLAFTQKNGKMIPNNKMISCPVTSQVRRLPRHREPWILQSLAMDGSE